jgi:rhamnose transport system ATP-binding protein
VDCDRLSVIIPIVRPPLLEALSVSKRFAGAQALRDVSFDLEEGEVHALVGENGAGKSTLIRIITGAETPDSGSLRIRGRDVGALTPGAAKSLGIAAIYQQPALFPDLTVAENVALAYEPSRLWRRIDWRERARRTVEILARTGSAIDPDRAASSLSMPEQQIVEIAKALSVDAAILIMDEPTASLADRETHLLLQIVERLRQQGIGIVYISHRLEEVFAIADRVTVLRDGATVATTAAGEVTREGLIHQMVGRETAAVFRKREVPAGDTALELRRLSSRSAGMRDVSLSVRKGEILGLSGLVGSGRTELAETIFGLRAIDSGHVCLGGVPVKISSPADAIRLGVAYVPEDRSRHGVVGEMSIASNDSLASLQRVSRHGLIDRRAERSGAEQHVEELQIRTRSVDEPAASLSGGNQQKIAFARWLATRPKVLILDEPTQGVDVGAKAEIHEIIGRLAAEGAAILMISSELPEILALSDRVAVMRQGTLVGELARADATPQKILDMALHSPVAEPTP